MVPGTFDGRKYEDLRVLIPQSIKEYYINRGTWEDIVGYRSYAITVVVSVKIKGGIRKDKWRSAVNYCWSIEDDEFVWDYKI